MPMLICPKNGEIIDTHTELQNEFIKRIEKDGTEAALEWFLPIKNFMECSAPRPLRFAWSVDGSKSYLFELSETEDFKDPIIRKTDKNSLSITNLKTGQKYFWRVNGSDIYSFETMNNKFRFIEIGGVHNVRDVGGINVKQGLLYRGADLQNGYDISEDGKDTFVNELKIKTELNLRRDTPFPYPHSPAGENVRYVRLIYRPYKEIFEDEHRRGIVEIMNFLSDESVYPVFLHCLGGADRTGMIALYIRALLGECDEDIFIDYELTSLSNYAGGLEEGSTDTGSRSRNSKYVKEFFEMYAKYEGNNLAERTESFLLECGVTRETIEKIRKIFAKQ